MDYCFARDAIEDPSLEETRGAISPLGAVAPQGNPKNPIRYLQRGIPNIWTTGPAPPSSNAQHLCKPGDAASLLGQRIHPHCRVILRSCFSRLFFFFLLLTVKMARSFVYLFNESWVSHKHKKLGFRKAPQQIARVMKETHDLATLQLYTGIFGFKKSGLQETHVLRNTVLENFKSNTKPTSRAAKLLNTIIFGFHPHPIKMQRN